VKIELKNKLEAVLFLEIDPIFISKLAENLKITIEKCQEELIELEAIYRKNNSALSLVFKEDEVQLAVVPELAILLKNYFKNERSNNLSPAMLEVLSIIVYKGPISKANIEQIRGVNCNLILRKLAIRGLIEKKEQFKNSRIFIYEPSLMLVKKLGVSRLEDLPDYDKITKELKTCSGKSF